MVLVSVDLLAALIVALEAEEGVLLASFVEANHSCLLFVHALREALDLLKELGRGFCILLFFHFQNNYETNQPLKNTHLHVL